MKVTNDSMPLAALTIGDFKTLLSELLPKEPRSEKTASTSTQSSRFVYGLRGIEQLFGVSHKTAQYYKDNLIQEAVRQNGRKIVVDVDLALQLFDERRSK